LSSNPSDAPLPGDLREALDAARDRLGVFGDRVHYFPSLSSSNDVASVLAERGAPEGTAVVAGAQTAGRGRRGHQWFSPPSAGLYVSLVFRPASWAPHEHGRTLITLAAGVALADAIRVSTGIRPQIKWPNDLVVGTRKLAGILAEASGPAAPFEYVILGFGVNVTVASYPPAIAGHVTSLERELGRVPDRGVVFAEAIASLAWWHADLVRARFDAILSRWSELSPASRGATVEWTTPAGAVRGTTAGIDGSGALLVRTGERLERIVGGELRWLARD
jgi:BirA family transcriptional regulator, biotin operon repressor / biotin---[acetyl-CoA-carboxylase] ligase